MDRKGFDQAVGLRRMLGVTEPRIFCFVGSDFEEGMSSTIFNLGGALLKAGSRVLIADAFDCAKSVSALLGVAQRRMLIDGLRLGKDLREAVDQSNGMQLMTLRRNTWGNGLPPQLVQSEQSSLDAAVRDLAEESDYVFVDGRLGENGLPIAAAISPAQIVVRMTANAEALKQGYALIKRLVAALGLRRIGVVIVGASEQVGAKVFANLAQAASQYLSIDLIACGTLPNDPAVIQAESQRRSVVEAFPNAEAAMAFKRVAESLAQVDITS